MSIASFPIATKALALAVSNRLVSAIQLKIFTAVGKSEYLSNYTDLAEAKTLIGESTRTRLKITDNYVFPDTGSNVSIDFPRNWMVEFDGDGRITVNRAGDTVHIKRLNCIDNETRFFGIGKVIGDKGAITGTCFANLWIPTPTVATPEPTITANQWDCIKQTIDNNEGGDILFATGKYLHNFELIPPNGSTILGTATSVGIKGTIFKQTDTSLSTWLVSPGARNISFQNFACELASTSTGSGILIQGVNGQSSVNGIHIKGLEVNGGEFGVKVWDTAVGKGWLAEGVDIFGNFFLNQSVGCIGCNTPNTGIRSDMNVHTPYPNGVADAYHLVNVGNISIGNSEDYAGYGIGDVHTYIMDVDSANINVNGTFVVDSNPAIKNCDPVYVYGQLPGQIRVASATDINTTTDKIAKTAHGYNNNDILRYTQGTTKIPELTNLASYFVVNKTANDFQISLTLGGAAINFSGTGTGTQLFDVFTLQEEHRYFIHIDSVDPTIKSLHRTGTEAEGAGAGRITFPNNGGGRMIVASMRPILAYSFTCIAANVNTTSNSFTGVNWNGLTSGVFVRLRTTGTLPSTSGGPLNDGDATGLGYYINTRFGTLHNTSADGFTGANPIDITTQGTGTHTLWWGRPRSQIYLGGQLSQLNSYSNQGEGFAFQIYADTTYLDGYRGIINLYGENGQAINHFACPKIKVDLYGGRYIARSFTDELGVAAQIHNHNASHYSFGYGINEVVLTSAGHNVEYPYPLENFIGGNSGGPGSIFATDDNYERGFTKRASIISWITGTQDALYPNTPSFKAIRDSRGKTALQWEVNQGFGNPNSWKKFQDLFDVASLMDGWTQLLNSFSETFPTTAGFFVRGGLANHGRTANTKWVGLTSGTTITIDPLVSSQFDLILDDNATLDINTPANVIEGQELFIVVLGGGATHTLDFNADFIAHGQLSLVTDEYRVLYFKYHASDNAFHEITRIPAGGVALITNAQDNGVNFELDADALITSAANSSTIGFHQDGGQNAIRMSVGGAYVKVMRLDPSGSNDTLYYQFVPATGKPVNLDVYQGDMIFSLTDAATAFCLKLSPSTTANDMGVFLWDVSSGTWKQVRRGAADSGGSGKRQLIIDN